MSWTAPFQATKYGFVAADLNFNTADFHGAVNQGAIASSIVLYISAKYHVHGRRLLAFALG